MRGTEFEAEYQEHHDKVKFKDLSERESGGDLSDAEKVELENLRGKYVIDKNGNVTRFEIQVPEGWVMRPSDKPGGTVFSDPLNPHNNIRVMPGNPNSPHPSQQVPYVKFVKDGRNYDVDGNPVPKGDLPEAHIPLVDFDIKRMPKFK